MANLAASARGSSAFPTAGSDGARRLVTRLSRRAAPRVTATRAAGSKKHTPVPELHLLHGIHDNDTDRVSISDAEHARQTLERIRHFGGARRTQGIGRALRYVAHCFSHRVP